MPGVALPISALTAKDRADLAFALDLGVDWIALSFVQRPEDVAEARALIGGRAALLAKIEKPQAIDHLEAIVDLADGIMVARGDLGVEMPPEDVPTLQKTIVREARRAGKPVIVATQMLESMVTSPAPTRAEASDVATAIFDGADAVMLSAETAAGAYPLEAVTMMDRIARRVEKDPIWRQMSDAPTGAAAHPHPLRRDHRRRLPGRPLARRGGDRHLQPPPARPRSGRRASGRRCRSCAWPAAPRSRGG